MKAYIIKIEILDSNPLIWRRVILPADATFNRLHEIIHLVTNFKMNYHLFEFKVNHLIVTNDEERIGEHQALQKNKEIYDAMLENTPDEFKAFERNRQKRLEIPTKRPTKVKIDSFLEEEKEISYLYDFGDDWEFKIRLEEIVEDYYFGYPTLLEGAESVPPEDLGGMDSFYRFLKDYRDDSRIGHADALEYAEALGFREYDPEMINQLLKMVKYKKTEWDKIQHKNYQIIEDKYRKE